MKNEHLMDNIDYCEEHKSLFVTDCAYCLIIRRKQPVVDLDNKMNNCDTCGHTHKGDCNCECRSWISPEVVRGCKCDPACLRSQMDCQKCESCKNQYVPF